MRLLSGAWAVAIEPKPWDVLDTQLSVGFHSAEGNGTRRNKKAFTTWGPSGQQVAWEGRGVRDGVKMAHGGTQREHGSQEADVREGCCTTFSDLLVAFLTALLSKARVTQPNPSKPPGAAGAWIGHDQPTQVPALSTVTWVGQAQLGAPLLWCADLPLLSLSWAHLPWTHITGPADLTPCSETAQHGAAPLLFLKSNGGTDGGGLPSGQGQLSQLPSLVHAPPPDIRCRGGGDGGRTGGGRTPQ